MKPLIAASLLLALTCSAYADKAQLEKQALDAAADCQWTDDETACFRYGQLDYRLGQCFRARPYADDSAREKLWIKGYHAQAKKKPRDMSHCYGTRK